MRSTGGRSSGCRPAPAGRIITAALLALLVPAGWATAVTMRAEIEESDGLVAALTDDQRLFLEAPPLPGEGLLAFARRLAGTDAHAEAIAGANGDVEALVAGVRYRVPYAVLRPELKVRVVEALFGDDGAEDGGWQHQVRGVGPLKRESLWHLAEWFTGHGENFPALREANDLAGEELEPGQVVTIPAELLLPAFRAVLPSERNGADYGLEYDRDDRGEHAVYRLRPGEALYSSVVVRFTGRVLAPDVNGLAQEIAERSGIDDVTDIPVGYAVKIPFDLLLPEYLPPGHPRRRAYEESRRASAAYSNEVKAQGLAGITVILDPGHGGSDVGASLEGVWESLYVYDVTLRVKRLLETHTAARVHTTTRDGDVYRIPDADVLPYSRDHRVLTSPPYPIEDSTVGVHLRWYLANSVFRRAVAGPADPDKVVFLSIHGDSLHPSLRGMMAYIPGANLSGGGFGKTGKVYMARQEVREKPNGSFSWRQRVRSEGLSRQLAEQMVAAFGRRELPIHPFKPVREKIIRRRGQAWVPAVLRYNAVPAKILLEICNLANDQDRRLIQTRAYRQRVAEAIVEGVLAYYGEGEGTLPSRAAEVAR